MAYFLSIVFDIIKTKLSSLNLVFLKRPRKNTGGLEYYMYVIIDCVFYCCCYWKTNRVIDRTGKPLRCVDSLYTTLLMMTATLLSWKGALICALLLKLQYLFKDIPDPWAPKGIRRAQLNLIQKLFFCSVENFAKYWHGYEVRNAEQLHDLPGSCLMLGYHSRCSVDLLYLFSILKPKMLVSYLFFRIPLVNYFLGSLGMLSSRPGNKSSEESFIEAITSGGKPLILLPGGEFEAYKSYHQRYKLQWKEEPGFARVMCKYRDEIKMKGGVNVIPFFTTNSEEAYLHSQYTYDLTGKWVEQLYNSFKGGNIIVLPLMLTVMAMGFGFILLPTRAKLVTHLGEPIHLQNDETPEKFAERIRTALQDLIDKVNRENAEKKLCPYVQCFSMVDYLNELAFGTYTFVQNCAFLFCVHVTLWGILGPLVTAYSIINLCKRLTYGNSEPLKAKKQ